MEVETRMVIVMRSDLKMSPGKMASQAAHAAVALFRELQSPWLEMWEACNTPKICLRVDSLEELETIEAIAVASDLPVAAICDAGRTQIEAGSKTCIAIVGTKERLALVTGNLKLL